MQTLSNVLPYDGYTLYFGQIFSKQEADAYFKDLLYSIDWQADEAIIFGKHYFTARKVGWYGEKPFSYTYSGITKTAHPFTKTLLALKNRVEKHTNTVYNSCLLNLYHTGTESMAWHSDGEKMLAENGSIASLSFGAERKFSFKHKITKETTSILLENGSLLEMAGATQKNWLHRLPATKKIQEPRINLTFRQFIESKK